MAVNILIAAGLDFQAMCRLAAEWNATRILDCRVASEAEASELQQRLPAYSRVDSNRLLDELSALARVGRSIAPVVLLLIDEGQEGRVSAWLQSVCEPDLAVLVRCASPAMADRCGRTEYLLAAYRPDEADGQTSLFDPSPLTCAECCDLFDVAAGCVLAGLPLDQSLPGVARHIEDCAECHDEFDAFVYVLRTAKVATHDGTYAGGERHKVAE